MTVDLDNTGDVVIVPNGGSIALRNYNPNTNAGIQVNSFSSIERAIRENYIELNNNEISFENAKVKLNPDAEATSTVVNLFNNTGVKTKVAYTHSDGGEVDLSGALENLLLVGNKDSNKDASSFKTGSGNDTALGGAGDTFDLGGGRNKIELSENRSTNLNGGATINQTATSGLTEVTGFKFGFSATSDRVNIDFSANVSYKDGKLSFKLGGATLLVSGNNSSADLAESADLFEDTNFIGGTTLDDITPITYEQGDYQNIYSTTNFTSQETITAAFAE